MADLLFAATVTALLSWTAPTQNVDGSPIAGIGSYTLHVGRFSRIYDEEIVISASNASYTWSDDLQNGDVRYYALTVTDTNGNTSGYSNEVMKTFSWTEEFIPGEPGLNDQIIITVQCPPDRVCVVNVQ